KLTVSLRAKRRTPRRYTASLSACDAGAVSYASTWEAIQNTIFARHDCANVLCHGGATPQGGLDLRPDVAYKNLVQVASTDLPPLTPITAIPLDAPPPDQGHQFVMPPWRLEAHSQHELCFATYFDFTDQVPAPFKDSFGNFLWNAQSLRQDPQSHHLILNLFS